ncbi:MAG: outer membrane protein transport protein, partial [Candidatus Cloacimonetes bacterium]|nr:outer membrane protein transport protein [Candidatus Cloacimonadota bacterium]
MKKYILPILFILCLTGLAAFSITDKTFGYKIPTNDIRSISMGGTGVAHGLRPMDAFINPAVLLNLETGYWGQVGVNGSQFMDKRSFPFYDSFEGYVDDATYETNFNYNAYLSGSIAWIYGFNNAKLAVGARYNPLYDFTGFYKEQVRNNNNSNNDGYPERIADNEINNKGNLNGFSFDIGYGIDINYDYLSNLGVAFEFTSLMGDINQENKIEWTNWARAQAAAQATPDTLYNYYLDYQRDLSGIQYKAGFTADLGERISIGFAYTPKTTIDVSSTANKYLEATESDTTGMEAQYSNYHDVTLLNMDAVDALIFGDYDLPASMRFGFSYRPRNIMKTQLNIEAEYVNWSDINAMYDDAWNYYFGIEHSVTNMLPLRIGFSSETSYQTIADDNFLYAIKLNMPSITAGSGYEVMKNLTLDFALTYSFREYEALDLFPDSFY